MVFSETLNWLLILRLGILMPRSDVSKVGGKGYRSWSRSERSKKLMEYYEKNRPYNCTVYYEVKGANKDKVDRQITGTYVPKELILDIASIEVKNNI